MSKMISLYIDTATIKGSIAIYNKDRLLFSRTLSSESNHLHVLHSTIEKGIKKAGITLEEISMIGVDIGPGSFTGIRIGVTTARTLAQLGRTAIFGVPSLDILCQNIPFYDQLICAVVDGKKKRLFCAFYQFDGKVVKRISSYFDISAEELLRKMFEYKCSFTKVQLIGALQQSDKNILLRSELKVNFASRAYFWPMAKNIHYLQGQDYIEIKKDYEKVVPFYLRKSD
ncbi:MAG: tRNA (adenosine(37)-N6)-threonylcarbamoyltransferase complex dimerization subunit type 1 TsaB, partial [Spirochaetes bacterium]|nr:tRNA (adenosine(37)-N6)-threonylcarbamoyltransferase complex dimerization subunit type 1 TsaB [Spirochaetota bacterium]